MATGIIPAGGGEAQNVFLDGPRERTTGEGVTTTSHTPDDPKGSADINKIPDR